MHLGHLYFKTVIFRNYAVRAETVPGKLVNFRETRFRDSVRESEAENGDLNGGTMRNCNWNMKVVK